MRRLMLLALLIGILSPGQPVRANVLGDYHYQNLRGGEDGSLAGFEGKPTLLMFFEPECPWCVKQAGSLQQHRPECAINQLALGINADRHSLKRALLRLNFPHPAYRAPPKLLKDMGGIPGTPVILLLDKQGELLAGVRGFTEADKLYARLCQTRS